ncbi:hypothetical protein PENTCL1PPCAC_13583, partial [Pristionchus entomophagus]
MTSLRRSTSEETWCARWKWQADSCSLTPPPATPTITTSEGTGERRERRIRSLNLAPAQSIRGTPSTPHSSNIY